MVVNIRTGVVTWAFQSHQELSCVQTNLYFCARERESLVELAV